MLYVEQIDTWIRSRGDVIVRACPVEFKPVGETAGLHGLGAFRQFVRGLEDLCRPGVGKAHYRRLNLFAGKAINAFLLLGERRRQTAG